MRSANKRTMISCSGEAASGCFFKVFQLFYRKTIHHTLCSGNTIDGAEMGFQPTTLRPPHTPILYPKLLHPVAQRGHSDGEDIEVEPEIFTKVIGADHFLQIPVGCRDDPDVRGDRVSFSCPKSSLSIRDSLG